MQLGKWLVTACVLALAGAARSEDVSLGGRVINPGPVFGPGAAITLTNDASFVFWRPGGVGGDIALNGFKLEIACGGNRVGLGGAISGDGTLLSNYPANLTLGGTKPNTFKCPFTFTTGSLTLAKPDGVDAIPGDLVLGTQSGSYALVLGASDQINDAARVVAEARGGRWRLKLQGHRERFAELTVKANLDIEMGEGDAALVVDRIAPDGLDLKKWILVRGFKEGQDRLQFNAAGGGLTPEQLAIIGFSNPLGRERGTYAARAGKDGVLEMGALVVPRDPPYELSEQARAERASLYEVPGRSNLSAKGTPLKPGMKIALYGDSITMLGGYVNLLRQALADGEGSRDLKVEVLKHGLNGGRVTDLLAGKSRKGKFDGTMEELLKRERPDVVSVWIGVNDVWFGKDGTTPEEFETGLRQVVALARGIGAKVVLAPPATLNEDAGHWNPTMDQYAEITRKVARETGAAFADLRTAFVAYTRNHGYSVLADGRLFYEAHVLAGDGVHANGTGSAIAADLIAQAICEELRK